MDYQDRIRVRLSLVGRCIWILWRILDRVGMRIRKISIKFILMSDLFYANNVEKQMNRPKTDTFATTARKKYINYPLNHAKSKISL